MCILPSFTVFSVDASNPMMDIRVIALITDFLEILVKEFLTLLHLSSVGLTRP